MSLAHFRIDRAQKMGGLLIYARETRGGRSRPDGMNPSPGTEATGEIFLKDVKAGALTFIGGGAAAPTQHAAHALHVA